MPKLISSYIPGQVAKYLGKHVLDATLTRRTPGERDPYIISAGRQSIEETYEAKGFVKSYDGTEFPGAIVQKEDLIVALLGGSLDTVPQSNDTVTIEHPPDSGELVTFRVEGVHSDPVGAIYKCLARR
ncbi:MAG: hypothetical protein QOI20_3264 [Acidimicrobiaceae bacterium]|jgi:hypothetical protein|nr:hypothetical protein [Acidimicrobiaceae bacterium]